MSSQNLRVLLQTHEGFRNVHGLSRVQIEIPGEHTGSGILVSSHVVARGAPLVVKPVSNMPVRYFDPSTSEVIKYAPRQVEAAPEVVPVVVEDEGLEQFFSSTKKVSNENAFASIGIMYEDEDVESVEEEPEAEAETSAEVPEEIQATPDEMFTTLVSREGTRNFGIAREELAALKLTVKQVKAIYVDVIGRPQPGMVAGKMKKKIREMSGVSKANYSRVLASIKRARQ